MWLRRNSHTSWNMRVSSPFFQPSYHSAFCSPLSHNNAHTQTCCMQRPAPLLVVLEEFNASAFLLDCLYDHLSSFVRSFLSHIHVHAVSPWTSVRERGCLYGAVVGVTRCPDDVKQYFLFCLGLRGRSRRRCALKCKAVHGGRVLRGFSS